MTRLVLTAALLALVASREAVAGSQGARTNSQENAAVREDVRAAAELVINGRPHGDTWLTLRGDDVLVPTATLTALGLRWTHGIEHHLAGEVYVSLASLAPSVRFAFSPTDVRLALTVPAGMFSRVTTIEPTTRPAPSRPRARSVYLNYGATFIARRPASWATEVGARVGGGLLQTSLAGTTTRQAVRGPLTFTVDDERRLWRWQMGDGVIESGVSGGVRPMAGLAVSSEFSIDPQFTTFAPVSIAGGASTPAVADIYVNGQLVARSDVAPGTFEIRDLAVPVGSGDVRVVVRDAFGRVQEITRDYYRSPGLVRPGLQVFRYAVGATRVNANGLAWRYGPVAGAGEHRVGLSEWLTVGVAGGFERRAAFGGGDVAVRMPIGEIEVSLRGSRARGESGAAGLASYIYRGRRVSGQAAARIFSANFREENVSARSARAGGDVTASIDVMAGAGISAGLRYRATRSRQALSDRRDADAQEIGTAVTFPVASRVNVSTSMWRGVGQRRPWTALAVLTVPLGRRTSATLTYEQASERGPVSQGSVQRALDLGPGAGYQVQWQDGASQTLASAALQYQAGPVRVEARREAFGDVGSNSLSVAGAVVAVDRSVRLSRPVTDAFALVRVGGIRGVRAYLSNQYVGRTGRRGDVVVPSLASYNANQIGIDDRDVPFYADVPRTDALIAPALGGGAVVRFEVTGADDLFVASRSPSTVRVVGAFRVDSVGDVLSGAEAVVRWSLDEERIDVRADGRFEFTRATIGTHQVTLHTPAGAFACSLVLSADGIQADGSLLLSAVPCQAVVPQTAAGIATR